MGRFPGCGDVEEQPVSVSRCRDLEAERDAVGRSALVTTVRTWMERDRHNEAAAFTLAIHPNTLAYRLRRFEQLSGRNLTSSADLAELWLALRAAEHTGEGPIGSTALPPDGSFS